MISLATTTCRICGSEGVRPHATMPNLDPKANPVTFLQCDECETIFDPAAGHFDYVDEAHDLDAVWPAFQYYFEVLAGVNILAKLVHLAQSIVPPKQDRSPRRFMDIGGGTGITCEIAQRLGWESVNFEPCPAGYFGERMLDIKVVHEYLGKGMLPEHSFDAIVASEVIEHVPEPDEFVSLIAGYLSDDGVAILTTPNSAPALHKSIGETDLEETYCPGIHLNLFSARSLEQVLRRNGFADVRIFTAEGTTGQKRLFALACRREGLLPVDASTLVDRDVIDKMCVDHLRWVLDSREQSDRRDSWYRGACYRLFEHYVNIGACEEAEPYRELIDAHLLERGLTNEVVPLIQAANFFEFMQQVPAYLGKYCYFRGIYELNFKHDAASARTFFHTAQHICAIQESITNCPGQFSLLARFHEGIALLTGGQQTEALDIFEELERKSSQFAPSLRLRIRWQKAIAMLKAGHDAAAVGQFVMTAMEHFDFIKPSMRAPIQHILIAVAQRFASVRGHIQNQSSRLEAVAEQVIGDLTKLKPQLASRLDRLDRLADRGAEVAGHASDQIASSAESLKQCMKIGAEIRRDVQSRIKTGTARFDDLIDHGESLFARLDSQVRQSAANVDALASRCLDLAQRGERGITRANDTSLRVQQFLERNQEPAMEIVGRCRELFTALEGTTQSVQRTVGFIHRSLATAGSVVMFPARVVRTAWRAIGLPSKRVSVRRIGMRHALEFEGRIPLGELVAGIVIEQQVVAAQNGLSAVALSFGICHRTNHCTLQVSIVDAHGEVIRDATVSAEGLPDNRPFRFEFAPLTDSEDKPYRVRITSSDGVAGNAVTVWGRLTNSSRGLTYNGKPIVDGELMVELCYS